MNESLIPGAFGVTSILGFNNPELVGSDDDLRVLDARPEFPNEVWAEWEAEKQEQFEERWPTVQAVLGAFEELRIYLLDVSPGNIEFL